MTLFYRPDPEVDVFYGTDNADDVPEGAEVVSEEDVRTLQAAKYLEQAGLVTSAQAQTATDVQTVLDALGFSPSSDEAHAFKRLFGVDSD